MKLNLQQENHLSKEEKQKVLGGHDCYNYQCYVSCSVGGQVGANTCSEGEWRCRSQYGENSRPVSCYCKG